MTEQREPVDPAAEDATHGQRWTPEPDPATEAPEVDPRLVDDEPAIERLTDQPAAVPPYSADPVPEAVAGPADGDAPADQPGPIPDREPVPDPEPGWHPVSEPPRPDPEPAPQPDPAADPEPAPGPATSPVPGPDLVTDPHPTAETAALPGAVPAAAPGQAIFRDSPPPQEDAEPLSDEARKLAAERAARKEAREAALAATAPVPLMAPEPVVVEKRTNDKFAGSLGLFLLRLVVAAIFTVRGITMLTNLVETQEQFAQTIIPYPQVMAIVAGAAHLLIALAMVLGLLTRVAGLGVLLIAGGALAFVMWGPWSPFVPGQPGFLGELELLLAAVGLLFLLVGAGGWSVDRSFRSARVRDRAERQMA